MGLNLLIILIFYGLFILIFPVFDYPNEVFEYSIEIILFGKTIEHPLIVGVNYELIKNLPLKIYVFVQSHTTFYMSIEIVW